MIVMKFSGTITLQYETQFSPFRAEEYEEALDWLVSSGFDGAEVCISNYIGVDIEKIRADLDKRKLGCSTISTGQARTLEDISLLHDNGGLIKAQERMKQHIDAAAILDCKVTLGLLRGLGKPGMLEEDKKNLAKNMEKIIDYAEQKNVILMLEAINRYETSLFNTAESTLDFIKKDLGNPKCMGVLWDIFHANIEDTQFDEVVDCLGDRLKHVHMADSNRHFPGYGRLDFNEIVCKLKSSGFPEYMSFECLNLPSLEVVKEEAGTFISKMRIL